MGAPSQVLASMMARRQQHQERGAPLQTGPVAGARALLQLTPNRKSSGKARAALMAGSCSMAAPVTSATPSALAAADREPHIFIITCCGAGSSAAEPLGAAPLHDRRRGSPLPRRWGAVRSQEPAS